MYLISFVRLFQRGITLFVKKLCFGVTDFANLFFNLDFKAGLRSLRNVL